MSSGIVSCRKVKVHADGVALRPIRVDHKNNLYICFDGVTWDKNQHGMCDMWLRRAAVCGELVDGGSGPLGIDILDKDGDIVQTLTISKRGFEYLRAKLKFRREP